MRGDQLARQWQLIQRLAQSRVGLGLDELAEALGCVRRTVYRDLDALMYAGFPVVSEKRDGRVYYRFIESFGLGDVPFNHDEVRRFLEGARPGATLSEKDVEHAFLTASNEAAKGFNNPDVYLERFIEKPRHIEFQILADKHGGVWTLGERECSLQRRHQKVMEEAPSPAMSAEQRAAISDRVREAVAETGYHTVGTLEFLMDETGELYFLEMNTRIQVEHPVTEMVTGIDLVEQQLVAASGAAVQLPDTRQWRFRGHALECRINAEDPKTFAPWPGVITEYHPPGGGGIRIDSGVYGGWRVPSCYDSLIAKVISYGATRADAIAKMRVALDEFIIAGIRTNIPLHQALLADPAIQRGDMSTRSIEALVKRGF